MVGGEINKKKKKKREREKIGEIGFWLGGGLEGNFSRDRCVFSPDLPKSYFSNLERKFRGLYFNPINYIFVPSFCNIEHENLM